MKQGISVRRSRCRPGGRIIIASARGNGEILEYLINRPKTEVKTEARAGKGESDK